MTHLLDLNEKSPSNQSMIAGRARISVKDPKPVTGFVDGAWWPRTTDLVAEVPSLVAALNGRLGAIARLVYHLGYWDTAPTRLVAGGREVKLDGYRFQPIHTVYVIGTNRDRLVLLVVPPATDVVHAHEMMLTAATADNASTAAQLLGTR